MMMGLYLRSTARASSEPNLSVMGVSVWHAPLTDIDPTKVESTRNQYAYEHYDAGNVHLRCCDEEYLPDSRNEYLGIRAGT